MAKKKYPNSKELQNKFIEAMNNYHGFEFVTSGVVSKIKFDGNLYFIYFKCVSPEGNPYPIEKQRAQLPQRPEFNEVVASDIPFIFLGYDVDHDVYVCWEPSKVKPRLNKKSYVSFYSRLSAQESVEEGKIKEEVLTNGDKFVLFKRNDIVPFFQMIDTHFDELKKISNTISENTDGDSNYGDDSINGNDFQGKLSQIEDDISIQLLVDSFSEDASCLDVVAACMNDYGVNYSRMTFSDWAKVVRTYLNKQSYRY